MIISVFFSVLSCWNVLYFLSSLAVTLHKVCFLKINYPDCSVADKAKTKSDKTRNSFHVRRARHVGSLYLKQTSEKIQQRGEKTVIVHPEFSSLGIQHMCILFTTFCSLIYLQILSSKSVS